MIVSREGYILTNDHVVDGVSEIHVTLSDGRALLGKIVGGAGVTTLMITETPPGNTYSGTGMQEFIADGVVHFHLVPVAGDARVRYLEITKMRGTNHQMGPIPIEITRDGITVRSPHIPGRS